jgi:endonuclease IV
MIAVLENMCGETNTVGGSFLELRRIINRITDKTRVGVCLDICHAFAYGSELLLIID